MSATVLNGSEVVQAMDEETAATVIRLKDKGISPTLAIVRVGEREDDISYERGAGKRADKVGISIRNTVLDANVSQEVLRSTIDGLNADPEVHGILLLRPLPAHIDESFICNSLDPAKDIDGITDLSLAGVFEGKETGFAPCTAQACLEVLKYYDHDLRGKRVVVIGRSLVIGKPVAMMLLGEHATVTISHSKTEDLSTLVREAEIVIACIGRAQMIDAAYLSEGQIVIDVGINFTEEGRMVGDVAYEDALDIVSAITPVPGGIGTVTTSTLMKHVVEATLRTQ